MNKSETTAQKTEKRVWIPEISNQYLGELGERIKPIVRMIHMRRVTKLTGAGASTTYWEPDPDGELMKFAKGNPYFIEPVSDLRSTVYLWDPKPTVIAVGLKRLRVINTYHTRGNSRFFGGFRPTIGEVLAQIPKELVDKVVAFEMVENLGILGTIASVKRANAADAAGYDMGTVRLYVPVNYETPQMR